MNKPASEVISYLRGQHFTGPVQNSIWIEPGYVLLKADKRRLEIASLWVAPEKRGAGDGRRILEYILRAADRAHALCWLRTYPFDLKCKKGMSAVQLRDWYGEYGFEVVEKVGKHFIMERAPR